MIKAIEDNYANSNWDLPNEDSLFTLELRNVEQRMEEATAADLDSLQNVVKTYREYLNDPLLKKAYERWELSKCSRRK